VSTVKPRVDLLIVDGLDDIDMEGLERRLALLAELAPGTIHAGTEGVGSGGWRLRSDETGLSGMVFPHTESVSSHLYSDRGINANLSFQMPADQLLKDALAEGRPGIEAALSIWNEVLHDAKRIRQNHEQEDIHETLAAIKALILHANPEFPLWGQLNLTFPTWASEVELKLEGKEILAAAAKRMLAGILPKAIVVSRRSSKSHLMLPLNMEFKIGNRIEPIETMRVLARTGMVDPNKFLRPTGMKAGR
jgi:hypothetical protein